MVLTDSPTYFSGIADAGLEHQPLATGGEPASVELCEMTWVNTIIVNVKGAMHGSYHSAGGQDLPRYLAAMFLRAGSPRALRTRPMPYRLLKPAEDYW